MATLEELLARLELSQYAPVFAKEEIDLAAAKELTDEELKGLGLTLGARKKLLAAVKQPGGGSVAPAAPAAVVAAPPKETVASRFPPITPVEDSNVSGFPLEFRKGLRDAAPLMEKQTQRLRKLFGANWHFSAKFLDLFRTAEQLPPDTNAREAILTQTGNTLRVCFQSSMDNLEKFCQDPMQKEAFVAKTSGCVIAYRIKKGASNEEDGARFNDVLAYFKWEDVGGKNVCVVTFDLAAWPSNLDYLFDPRALAKQL